MQDHRIEGRRWLVKRLDYYMAPKETLGAYRWRWMAEIHKAWANIGLRMAIVVREDGHAGS